MEAVAERPRKKTKKKSQTLTKFNGSAVISDSKDNCSGHSENVCTSTNQNEVAERTSETTQVENELVVANKAEKVIDLNASNIELEEGHSFEDDVSENKCITSNQNDVPKQKSTCETTQVGNESVSREAEKVIDCDLSSMRLEENQSSKENVEVLEASQTNPETPIDIAEEVLSDKASSLDMFLNMNKQILYTLDNLDSIPLQPARIARSESDGTLAVNENHLEDVDVRPYTEQQLAALYYNGELEVLEGFADFYVESELRSSNLKNSYLYDLLVRYLKAREKITGNSLEVNQLRGEYLKLQQDLWTIDTVSVQGSALCLDGKLVSAKAEYNRTIFHRSVFENITRILNSLQKLLYQNHVLLTYTADDLRMQIDLYIKHIVTKLIDAANLSDRSPVSLFMVDEPNHLSHDLSEIRLSISILFTFQRRVIKDTKFLEDSRSWLTHLVAVLIRTASYLDHLFVIHHILRCPAGVSAWASTFIQVPLDLNSQEPFANYQINHLLSVLSVLLSPVKERRDFLKDINHSDVSSEATNWVMVDSDGEEDEEPGISLRENDLVALFNQLPLDNMFRCVLLIRQRDNKDILNLGPVEEQHVLRFFAFSSVTLNILHRGLQTYSQPKYNQFSKRLSRFIRHIVQYATDQWELFLKSGTIVDPAMARRLQAEYDAFFLRAIFYLYSSQKLLAWQFLAVVPYNMVAIRTLWKIYYFLHMPDDKADDIVNFSVNDSFRNLIWTRELRGQFEEKLSSLGDAEVYYLLNTFSNMALGRGVADIDFIYSATMDILQVGFVSQTTQESSAKSARILLAHITSRHPCLLSNILKTVQEHIDEIGEFSLFLYQDLPLAIWILTDEDLNILGRLLLNYPTDSNQTKLSRMILSRLNWDLLNYEMHCDTALLVLKAVQQQSSYLKWGWQTILRLKLHINDHHFSELNRVQELESYEVLVQGVRENQPLACFVAVLMTTWGHLVPLICSKGLDQLIILQTHQKHEAVLFALYQIIPIFITCQECLINCNNFQQILLTLLNADRGYISYAKSFIVTQNTILQQFGNMIETQIVNFAAYNLQSPRLLVRLWMNSLVSIPNWTKDNGILYLLDIIIKTAFFHQDAIQIVFENFRDLYQATSPQESPYIISVLKWASGSNTSYSLFPNSLAEYPWLAYVFFEIEHVEKEVKTNLWPELLRELARQKGKINVDAAIKNAASKVKTATFSSSFLCLYRYAQQAMDMPMDHPILPLMWQKFFILYLNRLPDLSSSGVACVGERFFDGIVNFTFLKRIKRKLQEAIDFYKQEIETNKRDESDVHVLQHSTLRHSIFEAFLLWLEEPRLHSGNLLLQSLPPQYEPTLLALIIQQNNQVPWFEYVDRKKVMDDQTIAIKLWRAANFREKSQVNQPLRNPGKGTESSDPMERILRRLDSYDVAKPPPSLKVQNIIIPAVSLDSREEMFQDLQPHFDTLRKFAQQHNLNLSEQKALDCHYQELVPQLFTSKLKRIRKKVPCKGKNQTVLCIGPADIILEIQDTHRNERVDHELQTNRQSFESLLEKALQSHPMTLHLASAALQSCVKTLQECLMTNPETAELGVELFYYLLDFFHEETILYPPAKSLFVTCIEKLGQSHVSGVEHEMPRLLQLILKEPDLGGYIAPYFLPSNSGNANILLMYSTITKEASKKYDIIFALVSKFEIEKWLNNKSPNLSQRSTFIQSIMGALSTLGYDPPIEAMMLHGLYRKHLLTVFEFQFPEHYGEILLCLLNSSNGTPENSLISTSVWMDVLNSLAKPAKIHMKAPLRDQLRQYAQNQKMLSHQELLESADMLSRYFTQERLNYGLYGLYPKCRNYMDIFVLLLGMTGHGLILSTLNAHQGLLGDRICEKIWPYLRELFAPWLIPYSIHNLKESMATWIQQLADDRTILLPWIPSDNEFAEKMIRNFCECLTFILETLPASSVILSYLWQWYVTSFCHTTVKDHIFVSIHQAFVTLPWTNFWPSLVDLEFMLRVVDQYLPECHSFLGYIFISIPWASWINSFASAPEQVKNRVSHCFLSLLVKLSVEPNIRKNHLDQIRSILIQAEHFDWSYLDDNILQHIIDWVVMSCDSAVIFKNDVLDLDYRLLRLLKTVSGYDKICPKISMDLIRRRQTFIKAHTKLLSVYVSKHRNAQNIKGTEIGELINGYLNDVDVFITTSQEMELILKEIVSTINITDIAGIVIRIISKWIENKTYGMVVKSLLKILGSSVIDYKQLASLYELTLTSYFTNNVVENNVDEPTWTEVITLANICVSKPAEFDQILIEEGSVLTLNVVLLQREQMNIDKEALLNYSIECIEKFKIVEPLESKIPLLWFIVINLALELCEKNESTSGRLLDKFSHILLQLSEDARLNKWGRDLLSVIGLSKSDSVSINFRFICRAMAGYILAQLPDTKLLPQKVRSAAHLPCAVGMPGGNGECSKVLLELDFRQSQGKIRDCAVIALTEIQDPSNSLHNASAFLWMLLKHFYMKPYLK